MAGKLPKPYYKSILDKLSQTNLLHRDIYIRIRDVCVAVEARKVSEIRKTLDILVANNTSLEATFHTIPEEIFYETMFRLLQLDRADLMCGLIHWYGGFAKSRRASNFASVKDRKIRFRCSALAKEDSLDNFEGNNWKGLFSCFQRPQPSMTTAELDEQWKLVERALLLVIPLFEKSPDPLPRRIGSFRLPVRPALGNGIIHLFEIHLNLFHLFLERTLDQLARPGSAQRTLSLPALDARWRAFKKALSARGKLSGRASQSVPSTALPTPEDFPRLAGVGVPSTLVEATDKKASLLDAFVPHKARSIEFNLYDRDESVIAADPKSLELLNMLGVVEKRLDFFLREFGHKPIPDAARKKISRAERQAFIRKKFHPQRLRNDADIARFICALYLDHLTSKTKKPARTKEDAWDLVVGVLMHFFQTQTSSTGFNLADDISYVDVSFPRIITGAELHDCGVYAIRLVNILLKFSACTASEKDHRLDFKISFVILPFHVGLIVEPENLPPLFVHNNHIIGLTAVAEQNLIAEWKASADPNDPDPADPAGLRAKFLEDLAAQLFLLDMDLPLLRIPLKGVSTPPTKKQLDRAYQDLVVRNYDKLFSGALELDTSDFYNFDTEFLKAQSIENAWHNSQVLTLWNETAHDLWHKTTKKNVMPSNKRVRAKYIVTLLNAVNAVENGYDRVFDHKREVSKRLRQNNVNILAKPQPRITLGTRFSNLLQERRVFSHIHAHIIEVLRGGKVNTPQFADPSQRLHRAGE